MLNIFGSGSEKVTGRWRTLHNEIHSFQSPSNIIVQLIRHNEVVERVTVTLVLHSVGSSKCGKLQV
jgi:hypothetical protein